MARIPNGILGEFIGSAANVSGYMRMGTNFVRAKRRRSNRPPTQARLAQQQKLKVCTEFTKSFSGSGFFNSTFPALRSTASGYNRATSALLNKAITGEYPDTKLSWPQVLVSAGNLPSPTAATAAAGTGGNIVFTWENNTGTGTAKDSDKAVLVAYSPELQSAAYLISDSRRKDGQALLPAQWLQGHTVETWMGFISEDGEAAADSVYAGRLEL